MERLLRLDSRGDDLIVLAFHRIATQPYFRPGMVMSRLTFRHLLDFLSVHAEVVDLSSANEGKSVSGRRLRVALTFDDGYRDNYENALPELSRYGFAATVFLATSLIDDPTRYLWWDQLDYVLRDWDRMATTLRRRILDVVSQANIKVDEYFSRKQVLNELVDYLRIQKTELRDQLVAAITDVSGSDYLTNQEKPRIMLNWDEVRKMGSSGISFGGHSVSHANLDEVGMDDLEHEITHCRRCIEDQTTQAVTSFAYPYGWYSEATVDVLRRSGYRVAVTCNSGSYRRGSDPFQIPRISLSDDDLRGVSVLFSRNMWNFKMLKASFM